MFTTAGAIDDLTFIPMSMCVAVSIPGIIICNELAALNAGWCLIDH